MRRALGIIGALCLLAPGCSSSQGPSSRQPVRLLAPDHLQLIVSPAADGWSRAHGWPVQVGLDTPDRLLRQANGGTRFDVFVSADPQWLDQLVADGHIHPDDRQPVAWDPLVFLAPPGRPPLRDPTELVLRAADGVGIVDPSLPEGELTKQALEATRTWAALAGQVRTYASSAALRTAIEQGELSAAVARRTTALGARPELSTHPFTPDRRFGATIETGLAHGGLDASDHVERARTLVFALSEGHEARTAWSRAGVWLHGTTGPATPPAPADGRARQQPPPQPGRPQARPVSPR